MSSVRTRERLRLFLIFLWLAFTVTFAIWWFALSSQHISLLGELQPDRAEHWSRQQRMILWEGSAWLVLLALGGGALIVLVQKEKLRVKRIREFFASFSHEVKTSLASLRLQAEALKDEAATNSPILDRLISDTVRLQLQLENSLFLASQDNLKLFMEKIALSSLVERMREQWPGLEIHLERDAIVQGDDRALRTIFSNILQNSIVHGQARKVTVKVTDQGGRITAVVLDDGAGFKGVREDLGELFHRPTSGSGSGLGLYICGLLMRHMGGQFTPKTEGPGFQVALELPGEAR